MWHRYNVDATCLDVLHLVLKMSGTREKRRFNNFELNDGKKDRNCYCKIMIVYAHHFCVCVCLCVCGCGFVCVCAGVLRQSLPFCLDSRLR